MTPRWIASLLRSLGLAPPPPMRTPVLPEAMRRDLEVQEGRLVEASARHREALALAGRCFLHAEQQNSAVSATVRRVVDRMGARNGGSDAS